MEIKLNGSSRQFDDGTTAAQLIELLDLTEKRLAVEINREILPRSQYGGYQIQPDDEIEIVHAIGGGAQ